MHVYSHDRFLAPSIVALCVLLISACQFHPLQPESSVSPENSNDSADAQLFTLASDGWLISQQDDAIEWGAFRTDPGAIVFHDGMYHMFRNVFGGFPGPVEIGYATSPDGIEWTEAVSGPILTSADVPYSGIAAVVTSALIEEDGTWVIYFHTWLSPSPVNGQGAIGRATASDPANLKQTAEANNS